ncbi:MAG: hypothetical protein HN341_13925 [Verrucomicrobia bacterium]|nr:hypothetical protein [Verrucomicrobiota bacterium]
MQTDVEKARVPGGSQPTLFPLGQYSAPPPTPKAVCEAVGLNWFAAEKLFTEGMLSFDPNTTDDITPAQSTELHFLGVLVVAGCAGTLLEHLLADLEKPYSYRLDRMYYDWDNQLWSILRGDEDVQLNFERWLDHLVDADELETLERLREHVEGAIFRLRQYHTRLSPW